jgi:hypothetical protein
MSKRTTAAQSRARRKATNKTMRSLWEAGRERRRREAAEEYRTKPKQEK